MIFFNCLHKMALMTLVVQEMQKSMKGSDGDGLHWALHLHTSFDGINLFPMRCTLWAGTDFFFYTVSATVSIGSFVDVRHTAV